MATPTLALSNALKFPEGGSFMLERLMADGRPSKDLKNIYTAGQNLVGVVGGSWNMQTEELRDENSDLPRAVFVTSTSDTVSLELRSEDPNLDIFLKGGERVNQADGTLTYVDLPITIPDGGGSYELKDPDGNAVVIDDSKPILVRDSVTNEDYEVTTGAVDEGKCKLDAAGGELIFAPEDGGKKIYFTATYKVKNVVVFKQARKATNASYRLTLSGKAQQYNGTIVYLNNKVVPSVQLASGDVAALARQISPQSNKTINLVSVDNGGSDSVMSIFGDIPVKTGV